jgi:predicted O-linked N-acetylglucosamine transferase (SPINDLY family)
MLGRFDEALAALEESLRRQPANPRTLLEIGNELMRRQDYPAAIARFQEARAVAPQFAEATGALARALVVTHQYDGAVALLRDCLTAYPRDHQIIFLYGQALYCRGETAAALPAFARAVDLQPDFWPAQMFLLYAARETGDWVLEDERVAVYRQRIKAMKARDSEPGVSQGLLYFPFTPAELHKLAQARGGAVAEGIKHLRRPAHATAPAGSDATNKAVAPIRLGYLAADFRQHPTMQLIVDLFAAHDRQHFHVTGYSVGPADTSIWQQRAIAALDDHVDLSALDTEAAAAQIAADGIDVLIDLSLYAQYARPEIAALRPAPLQLQWLGFPGTSGSPAYDYVIADEIVLPPGEAGVWTEKVLWMPDCYQPNRRLEPIAPAPTRASQGLPDEAMVFCCFNAPKKLDRQSVDAWCRILKASADSVLWLLAGDPAMQEKLRQQLALRDIDPARLVFAPKLPLDAHLARHQCADLFLDTFIYGAHTTASDALRAGLPLLTLKGESFAARVGASILTAAGMPELIASDHADYEAKAIELARNRFVLDGLRRRLKSHLASMPLFDVDRFARHLDAGLMAIVKAVRLGRKPAHLRIADLPPAISAATAPGSRRQA